jgi:hypothetical protein
VVGAVDAVAAEAQPDEAASDVVADRVAVEVDAGEACEQQREPDRRRGVELSGGNQDAAAGGEAGELEGVALPDREAPPRRGAGRDISRIERSGSCIASFLKVPWSRSEGSADERHR